MKTYSFKRYSGIVVFGGISVSVLVALMLPAQAQAFSGSGTGTSGDPFQITTCAQLQSIDDDLAAHYRLTQDVGCSASAALNSGAGFSPIGSGATHFSGQLDGDGHAIIDLDIVTPTTSNAVGIFSEINGGASVHDLDVIGGSLTGGRDCGMIVGAVNNGQIRRVSSSADVHCETNNGGGLVGTISEGTIRHSYNTGDVTGNGYTYGGIVGYGDSGGMAGLVISDNYYRGTITIGGTNPLYVGGIIGFASMLDFTFNFAEGEIVGGDYVGGMAGYMLGVGIYGTYSAMKFTSTTNTGPVVGSENASIGGGSYIDANISGFSTDPNLSATPIFDSTYAYDRSNMPFSGWDFTNIWVENYQDYPSFAATRPPYVECGPPSSTDDSVAVDCTVLPVGWGIPTWEMRYRKKGTATWTPLTQPDIHRASATVSGLDQGTVYEVGFRFTNNSGTGAWSMVEATTTGIAPFVPVVPPVPAIPVLPSAPAAATSTPAPLILQNAASSRRVTEESIVDAIPTIEATATAEQSDPIPITAKPQIQENLATADTPTESSTSAAPAGTASFYRTFWLGLLAIILIWIFIRILSRKNIKK